MKFLWIGAMLFCCTFGAMSSFAQDSPLELQYALLLKEEKIGKVLFRILPDPENREIIYLNQLQILDKMPGIPAGSKIEEVTMFHIKQKRPLKYVVEQTFGQQRSIGFFEFDYEKSRINFFQKIGNTANQQPIPLQGELLDPLSLLFLLPRENWETTPTQYYNLINLGKISATLLQKQASVPTPLGTLQCYQIELGREGLSQVLYLDVQKKYLVRIDSASLAGTVITLLQEVKPLSEFKLPDLINIQPELQPQPPLHFKPETREEYPEKEVTFLSQDTMLSGTLTLPRGNPPFPGVLLIAGSGPVDRDGNVPQGIQLNILQEMAYQLAECGFAVLRYDKRGVGKSGGDFAASGLYDLVADAQSALEFLTRQPEINSQRIALLGHSEGGTIACMVASENPAVSALVLMAAPARSLTELVKEQITYLYLISGVKDPQIIQEAIAQQNKIFEALAQGKKEVEGVPIPLWKWWKDYLEFDPQVFFQKIRVPTLILQGEKDYQVKTEDALKIAGILKQNGVLCKLVIFPDLDHLFRPVKGDFSSPEEYLDTSRKIPQEVFEKICSFLKKNL
ncbi:MAG: uncharacterized protein PWP60_374 [Candidatus Atribacteria bacterium]|nr:uncharacterized protein [Candidatus Atribacteria bacterium]